MRPEDIDKLFKERLGNSAPTPSGDLWSRLQERIGEEMPAQQKEKQLGFMWVRYSVAAVIGLLLAVGLVFYNMQHKAPGINGTVAQQPATEQPQQAPDFAPKALEEQAAPASIADAATDEKENNLPAQATEVKPDASNPAKAIAHTAEPAAQPESVMKKSTIPAKASVKSPAMAQTVPANKPAQEPAATSENVAGTEPLMAAALASSEEPEAMTNTAPVEIIIKRAVTTQTVSAKAGEPNGLEKKAKLAKNIFKQVRKLSNGEPVELADLGIKADKIAVGTTIGNQKFSKVINL
ncbi:hypothetical protein I2I11_16225 [Pontibacter sp. 172403-2]|uniref:hypothetical protein n=1 Tax=Pontibacter rufus TaxID=2791028 RepID=UPI0018AF9D31|nr:hypothetical protein [Pontibacter sp. 172403-2]MBF9254850.1 hypothetical protein [Pontibacter sp. 172403-2]